MTSFTPRKPRSANERRKAFQNGSASEAPVATPNTSRRPSVFTPTAIITATETIRPAWRDFRYVASIHRYGQAPSMGRERKAFTRSSISAHSRETCSAHSRETCSAHSRETCSAHSRETCSAHSRETCSAHSRETCSAHSRETCSAHSRETCSAHSRETCSAHSRETCSAHSRETCSAHSRETCSAHSRETCSAHSRETWLLEMPDAPMALTRSSTARVEIPWI